MLVTFDLPLRNDADAEELFEHVLFDPGSSHETERLKEQLKDINIDAVFVSHGHSDHVGALSAVPNALYCVGRDISRLDEYREVSVKPSEMVNTRLISFTGSNDERIEWITTPGHTGHCCTLMLYGVDEYGTVALVGDLWDEREDEDFWRDLSELPEVQAKSRQFILSLKPDLIVPGHGAPFKP